MNSSLPLRRSATAVAALLFLTLGASLARAQVTIYARFKDGTGAWAGESTDPGRTGWAKVTSVSFGARNPLTPTGTPGQTAFDPVNVEKAVDRLSPQIFIQLASGALITTGPGTADLTLEFVRVVNAVPATFFRVELRPVALNKTNTSASDGSSELNEFVELTASVMRYTYWIINPNGTQGASVVQAWNVPLGSPTF